MFTLGHHGIDRQLGRGLTRGCLHEAHARNARYAAAAAAFALALALRAAGDGRRIVWVHHRVAEVEIGGPYAPGLVEFGTDPDTVILVTARDPTGALLAAHETLRCHALGAVLIELSGDTPALDLTASRRLMLTASRSGVTAVITRTAASPRPSVALSRWFVAGAPSTPLAAGAPGHPVFDIALDRHRAGIAPGRWRVEWNRDTRCFIEPIPVSGAVAVLDIFPPCLRPQPKA